MKTKSNYLLLSTLVGGILFNLLFWSERLALNLLIYSLFVVAITFFNGEVIKSKKLIIYAFADLLAAVLVVINNSDLSLATYYISFILFVGFTHYQQIRTVWVAFLATALQIVAIPASLIKRMSELQIGNFNLKPIFRPIKYIIFPLIIVFIFTGIYSGANQIFGNYLSSALDGIQSTLTKIFSFIFQDLSFERFVHLCFGIALTGGLIITFYNRFLEKNEAKMEEALVRKRSNNTIRTLWNEIVHIFMGQIISKKLALKTEYIIALISFAALNFLLLILNSIDIWWLWLGKGKDLAETNYSVELHDGTNALIFSIVLAMVVIVYFFRGNLNFYTKSKTLKALAFAWMIQNFILIISVFIRDGHYIEVYGLTYKRIGVLVFAILCIIGLITVYIKVAHQKTLFYLFKINGNIWYILLLVFTIINWDMVIVKYNLWHSNTIALDVDYIISLSDKTLPILDQNRVKLNYAPNKNLDDSEIAKPENPEYYKRQLDERIGHFKERYEKVSWLSWNLPDWNTARYFGLNH